jgi:hypothetical protein
MATPKKELQILKKDFKIIKSVPPENWWESSSTFLAFEKDLHILFINVNKITKENDQWIINVSSDASPVRSASGKIIALVHEEYKITPMNSKSAKRNFISEVFGHD